MKSVREYAKIVKPTCRMQMWSKIWPPPRRKICITNPARNSNFTQKINFPLYSLLQTATVSNNGSGLGIRSFAHFAQIK